MKIALVRYKYTPYGGAERYMARLIDGLVAAGHEVHVFAAQWDAAGVGPVQVHRVPVISCAGWLKALTFAIGCRRLLKKERFDLIFSLERTLLQDVYRAGDGCHRQWLVRKNLGRGMLARAIDFLNPLHAIILLLEKRLFTDRGLKGIIANSKQGKEEIISIYGVEPEKIHVIYNGIDLPQRDPSRREQCREELRREFALRDELRLLYVGSGFRRKGVPTLLAAASRLTVPFRLFVVGKGRIRHYRVQAGRLGIADRVEFTGPVKDVERFYQGCDLFVLPTLYDPFSNATVEAMSWGLPVLTSAYNGVAELIRQGENGFVVDDPLNAAAVAEYIGRMADSRLRQEMGARALQTVAPLTMAKNVAETLRVLDLILTQKRAENSG